MQDAIQNQYTNKVPHYPDVKVGAMCIAKYKEDGLWYRARIDMVISDDTVKITFVDYGNEDNVKIENLRRISPALAQENPLALRCKLFDTNGKTVWTDDLAELFWKLCDEGELTVQCQLYEHNVFHVILRQENRSTGSSVEINSAIARSANYLSTTVENISRVKIVQQFVTADFQWKDYDIELGKTVSNLKISYMRSPNEFYLQLPFTTRFKAEAKSIDKIYKKLKSIQGDVQVKKKSFM